MANQSGINDIINHPLPQLVLALDELVFQLNGLAPSKVAKVSAALDESVIFILERVGRAEMCRVRSERARMLTLILNRLGGIRLLVETLMRRAPLTATWCETASQCVAEMEVVIAGQLQDTECPKACDGYPKTKATVHSESPTHRTETQTHRETRNHMPHPRNGEGKSSRHDRKDDA
jgi:hypothetical protein